MKTSTLSIVLLCFLCLSSYAQKGNLTPIAAELFKNANTKLSTAEKNHIAELSGFELTPRERQLYKPSEKNAEPIALDVRLYVLDLTGDGVEEIGVMYTSKNDANRKNKKSMLFVEDTSGNYQLNLDLSGEFYFLDMNALVFPDIFIKNSSQGLVTYRWNGNNYKMHKFLKPGKLKKYQIATMITADKSYSSSQIGE